VGKLAESDAPASTRARSLVAIFQRLVTDVINGVALSWFAKEARKARFSQSFVKATGYVDVVGWTFCLTIISSRTDHRLALGRHGSGGRSRRVWQRPWHLEFPSRCVSQRWSPPAP